MVISIAIKIMISIVLNLDILSHLRPQMVKSVQQVAIRRFLVNLVLVDPENIVVVYVKNIRPNVILNVVTMIQARDP